MGDAPMVGGKRRVDRVLAPDFVRGLESLDTDEVRSRRDLARAELEYRSYIRRLIQGRRDILQAELERRQSGEPAGSVVDRLASILADEPHGGPSRGEAPFMTVPEEEVAAARRRVERLVSDASLSNIEGLSDDDLQQGIAGLEEEERSISDVRARVIDVHDEIQDELKRRFRDQLRTVPR